ncbi:hypothetical protein [Phytohabitans suffuscus]
MPSARPASCARALRAAHEWAGRALQSRGGTLLVVARYVPGGRTTATLVAGSELGRHLVGRRGRAKADTAACGPGA